MSNDEFKDYYKILQVDRHAVQEVITVSYKSLAKKYHPDLNLNNLNEANEKMKVINEAYNILNNAESRTKYNLIYDSYTKNTSSNNSINNTYDSYMTKESSKVENIKKEDIKRNSYLKFNKRTVIIAIIAAIFFIYIIAENILTSNDYARINKLHKDISVNRLLLNKMELDFNSNHLDYSNKHSSKLTNRKILDSNVRANDISKQEKIYTEEVIQLNYLNEEIHAPSALIHRLFN